MKHPPGEPMPSLRSGQGGGGFIDGAIPWTFIFYIVRLIGTRGLRPHMTLSCHPLFASHVCLLLHVSKVFRLKDRGLVPNFCHIYSLESGLDRNTECWRPIGQWVYKGYLTIKFSSVLLLTPWWKDPSKMISKDAKKIAKMICLKRLGGDANKC